MSNPLIRIFDTTLRDGEQSPGCSMNLEEKLQLARQLERLGVDIIEAGFPIASQGDFESVQAIAVELKDTSVCGLARTASADIERAGQALELASQLEFLFEVHAAAGRLLSVAQGGVKNADQLISHDSPLIWLLGRRLGQLQCAPGTAAP